MSARITAGILALLMLVGQAFGSMTGVPDAQQAAFFLAAIIFVAVGLMINYWDGRK